MTTKNEENRERHKKLIDRLYAEEARIETLGKFRGTTILAVRTSGCTDEQWKKWCEGIGKKLS